MTNYASWRPPSVPLSIQDQHPECLTPKQRKAFWALALGRGLQPAAHQLEVCLNTLKNHKIGIQERIPGLRTYAAYGMLAAQIINDARNSAAEQGTTNSLDEGSTPSARLFTFYSPNGKAHKLTIGKST